MTGQQTYVGKIPPGGRVSLPIQAPPHAVTVTAEQVALWNAPQPDGFLETCVSVVTSPVAALRQITAARPIGWAFAVITVISIGVMFGQLAPSSVVPPEEVTWTGQNAVYTVAWAVIGGPLIGFALLAFVTSALWAGSRIIGGHGSFGGLFGGAAFAFMPQLVVAPLLLVTRSFNPVGGALSWVLGLGSVVWVMVLLTIVVRESNAFSTGKAIGAMALSCFAFMMMLAIASPFVVIVALMIAAARAA